MLITRGKRADFSIPLFLLLNFIPQHRPGVDPFPILCQNWRTMEPIQRTKKRPIALSVFLHAAIIAFLVLGLPSLTYRAPGSGSNQPQPKIVQATAINSAQVQKEVDQIRHQEEVKAQAEQKRVDQLKAQADAAQQKRVQEEKKLAAIKETQEKIKQQAAADAKAATQAKLQAQADAAKKANVVEKAAEKAKATADAKALAEKKQQAVKLAKQKVVQSKQAALAAQQKALQDKLMQQQMASDQNQLNADQSDQLKGIVDKYKAEILQAIGQQWLIPDDASKDLSALFLIDLSPSGDVLDVKLMKTSGNDALDQSARVAILKASPLPVPTDPAAFDKFRQLLLTVSPKEIVST